MEISQVLGGGIHTLVEHNLYLSATKAAGSGIILAINNVPLNMLILRRQSFWNFMLLLSEMSPSQAYNTTYCESVANYVLVGSI
jgi:hypothetical protein